MPTMPSKFFHRLSTLQTRGRLRVVEHRKSRGDSYREEAGSIDPLWAHARSSMAAPTALLTCSNFANRRRRAFTNY